jgi:superfamily II DNA or RNA helicase
VNEIKNKKQQEFANLYLSLKKRRAGIISCTGSGKSRIIFLILDKIHQDYEKVYIVVNADRLRDFTWKEEFAKWKREDILAKTELVNYQTTYKWTPKEKDLSNCFIVFDEIDFALGTPEYSKVFYNYKNIDSIGLTGYCTEDKIEEFNKLLPVIVNYTSEQGIKDKVINDVKIILVKFDLDKNPNGIEIKYKDKKTGIPKSFYQSENAAYNYTDKRYRQAAIEYDKGLSDASVGLISTKELNKLEVMRNLAAKARVNILYNCISSVGIVEKLEKYIFSKDPEAKVMVFSKYTKQCDKVSKLTYHTNNSKEVNERNFSNFQEGKIRILGVCSKVDRGENLVGLNNSILESYNSSDTTIVQRIGRTSRLAVEDIANFYILLPYYMKEVQKGDYVQTPTQACTWAKAMLQNFDADDMDIIDFRTIKSDL